MNATNGSAAGFAGGDGNVANAATSSGSTDLENGTKTGVAVVFDAWQGNYLPDTTPYSGGPGPTSAATDRPQPELRFTMMPILRATMAGTKWRMTLATPLILTSTT